MKYLIYCILFLAAVTVLSNIIFRLLQGKRQIEKTKRIKYKFLLAILFIILGSFFYLLPYQHAAEEALKYAVTNAQYSFEERKDTLCFLNEDSDTVFIFYPGAKVDTYAYCQLAGKLSETGVDVYLVKEPFHMAFFAAKTAEKIINETSYEKIYVGGHSLGGVVALNYSDRADGIILLASYPTKKTEENAALLSIYGDKDGCLEQEVYEKGKEYWPTDSKEVVIKGGNHAGFAQYGFQKGDYQADITADAQIEITVSEISRFIENNH